MKKITVLLCDDHTIIREGLRLLLEAAGDIEVYLSLDAQATWHRQVEEELKHLHSLTPITAAEVVLER